MATPDVASLYSQYLGRQAQPNEIAFWNNQAANGANVASLVANSDEAKARTSGPKNLFGIGSTPNLANGTPDYMALADKQSQYNQQNAELQSRLNNPDYYGPGGSQVRTKNADGTYSVTQSLSPSMQRNYDASNALQGNLLDKANGIAGSPDLSFDAVGAKPTFDTSGVQGIPQADANDLAKTRDSMYAQQTQYLDPQFQQAQSDLDAKLANQGIMPGSEAYNREINNLALTKQKAYSDARNSAIQAGGAEQSRLYGLGLQSHTSGMNDALAGFNTGMQGRQQGVSEATALHNAPINDISALRSGSQVATPTYQGQVGTNIPGVDYMNAANMGFNANMGLQNVAAKKNDNFNNGLFGLGAAALQSPSAMNGITNLFSGNGGSVYNYTDPALNGNGFGF